MAADLGVGAGAAGQTVTAFAVGAIVAAIPLTRATVRWDRRTLLLVTVAGFVVANTVTAVSSSFALTLVARFAAGLVAGLTWALLPGYVRRIVPADRVGRAMTIAMAGGPLALTLGVPAGAVLGAAVGWRWTFGVLSVVGVALLAWIRLGVPGAAGTPRGAQLAIRAVLPVPGCGPCCSSPGSTCSPTRRSTRTSRSTSRTSARAREPARSCSSSAPRPPGRSCSSARSSTTACAPSPSGQSSSSPSRCSCSASPRRRPSSSCSPSPPGAPRSVAPGRSTTAAARAAGDGADVAQSALVTVWNTSVALGGAVGGAALAVAGPGGLPWVSLALMVPVLATVARGRPHSFR